MNGSACDELGIPHRLRTLNKKIVGFNDDGEILYRWVKPSVQFGPDGEVPGVGAFQDAADISCNRSLFCVAPTDVLYNPFGGPHRFDHAVICATIASISRIALFFPLHSTCQIAFTFEHSPEPCMYPHTEIVVMEAENRLKNEVKPKTLRTLIRNELSQVFSLCHRASPDLQLEMSNRKRGVIAIIRSAIRNFFLSSVNRYPESKTERSIRHLQHLAASVDAL
jgi:hypothetical protein